MRKIVNFTYVLINVLWLSAVICAINSVRVFYIEGIGAMTPWMVAMSTLIFSGWLLEKGMYGLLTHRNAYLKEAESASPSYLSSVKEIREGDIWPNLIRREAKKEIDGGKVALYSSNFLEMSSALQAMIIADLNLLGVPREKVRAEDTEDYRVIQEGRTFDLRQALPR